MSKRTAKSKSAQRNQANREMFLAGLPKRRSRKAKVAVEPVAAVAAVEVPVEPVAVEPVAVEVAPVEAPKAKRVRKAKPVEAPVAVAVIPPAPAVEITETAKMMTGPKILAKFNEMVPTAQALGIKCHIHTSLFESRAKGTKQLTKLQAAIAQAQAVAQ